MTSQEQTALDRIANADLNDIAAQVRHIVTMSARTILRIKDEQARLLASTDRIADRIERGEDCRDEMDAAYMLVGALTIAMNAVMTAGQGVTR